MEEKEKAILEAKENVMKAVRSVVSSGFVPGTAGNISARVCNEDLFVITPSSYPYSIMTNDDLVVADLEGKIVEGKRKPSIEFDLHRLIYKKREDVNAVVHTHSPLATAVASLKGVDVIPPVDVEAAAYLGGPILVAPFYAPGSIELAEAAAESLGMNAAVLLKNHGSIGAANTMDYAVLSCEILERACKMYLMIKAAGELNELPPKFLEKTRVSSFGKRGLKIVKG